MHRNRRQSAEGRGVAWNSSLACTGELRVRGERLPSLLLFCDSSRQRQSHASQSVLRSGDCARAASPRLQVCVAVPALLSPPHAHAQATLTVAVASDAGPCYAPTQRTGGREYSMSDGGWRHHVCVLCGCCVCVVLVPHASVHLLVLVPARPHGAERASGGALRKQPDAVVTEQPALIHSLLQLLPLVLIHHLVLVQATTHGGRGGGRVGGGGGGVMGGGERGGE